jgi:hypothetical protein
MGNCRYKAFTPTIPQGLPKAVPAFDDSPQRRLPNLSGQHEKRSASPRSRAGAAFKSSGKHPVGTAIPCSATYSIFSAWARSHARMFFLDCSKRRE